MIKPLHYQIEMVNEMYINIYIHITNVFQTVLQIANNISVMLSQNANIAYK